jgi:ABC-type transporter Mla subunit MlaD
MDFIHTIEHFFETTEQDVIGLLSKVKSGVGAVETEVNAALKWLAGNAGTISADVQYTASVVKALGATSDPKVAEAVAAANLAVQSLNSFASAYNSGQGTVTAVVQGYTALKQAQAATATAVAAAAATVAPKVAN